MFRWYDWLALGVPSFLIGWFSEQFGVEFVILAIILSAIYGVGYAHLFVVHKK